MNALAPIQSPSPIPIPSFAVRDMERMAKAITKSGLFGVKSVDQALALMLIAQAEGRHPATAARDYDIIEGRPAKKAEAMLRDFLTAGGSVEWLELTDTLCRAAFSHACGGAATIEWSIPRAQTAGIFNSMWERYPRQMLRCRVVSEGVRTVYPMATSGMYVEEEVRGLAPATAETWAAPADETCRELELHPDVEPALKSETDQTDAQSPQAGLLAASHPARPRAQPPRVAARRLKADGEDERIRVLIEECDLAGLAEWEAKFAERTEHLPKSWLDPIRDWIALRREEVRFEAACAEMDAEYAASVG